MARRKRIAYKLLKKTKDVLKENAESNFKSKKDPDGKKWEPWSPSYARVRKKSNHTLLVKTGKMRSGFKYKIFNRKLTITNKQSYSGIHQHGSGKIPQRRMVGFGKEASKKMSKAMRDSVVEILLNR